MSTATVTTKPATTPNSPQNGNSALMTSLIAFLTALAAFLGGMQFPSSPKPDDTKTNPPIVTPEVVVPPRPEPVVQNVDPEPIKPVPDTIPKILPEPTPIVPLADVPVASIVITDANGATVVDQVGTSQQIVISSEKAVCGKDKNSLDWVIEPHVQSWKSADNRFVIATTGDTDGQLMIMQIVALGDKVAWQRTTIKVGHGSKPPPIPIPVPVPNPPTPVPVPVPTPTPVPVPTPTPTPVPTARSVFLAVVYDPNGADVDPAGTAKVLNAIAIWDSFRVNPGCDWRRYTPSTKEAAGLKAFADARAANVALPALVIYDNSSGKFLMAVPLPRTVTDLKSMFDQITSVLQEVAK